MKKLILVFCVLSLAIGCSKKKDDETDAEEVVDSLENIVESALTDASSNLDAAEGDSVLMSSIGPLAACDISTARSACSNNIRTVTWDGCTTVRGDVLTGVIVESYAGFGAAACQMTGSTSVLTRTISSDIPRKLTIGSGALAGATITSTNDPGTAWDGDTFPDASTGTVISRIETGTSNGQTCGDGIGGNPTPCLNVVVNGIHTTMKGRRGLTWFEHIAQADLTAKGTRGGGDRTLSGTSTVWHEILEYKAVNTFTSVVWGDSACCYPTSGSISSVLTGSITKSTTLTFTSTCGEATFNDGTDDSTVTLKQCQ